MKTIQKIQNIENLTVEWQTKKTAKCDKMAKCVFSWPVKLKNGQIFGNWS